MPNTSSYTPPTGYHSVTPAIVVRGAADAIEFYKRAFGAEELSRMPGPDGTIVHAEIKIGDSIVMARRREPAIRKKLTAQPQGQSRLTSHLRGRRRRGL